LFITQKEEEVGGGGGGGGVGGGGGGGLNVLGVLSDQKGGFGRDPGESP